MEWEDDEEEDEDWLIGEEVAGLAEGGDMVGVLLMVVDAELEELAKVGNIGALTMAVENELEEVVELEAGS